MFGQQLRSTYFEPYEARNGPSQRIQRSKPMQDLSATEAVDLKVRSRKRSESGSEHTTFALTLLTPSHARWLKLSGCGGGSVLYDSIQAITGL